MWPEVESTKNGSKRELKLNGVLISERINQNGIDMSIFELTNLNLLNISDTSLKSLPKEISNLTNLQTILLFGNELTELPGSIGHLDKLKVLDVSRNKLTMLPNEMSQLINLATINASNNELASFPSLELSKLGTLDLSFNKLTEFPNICIESCTNLSEINFQNNEITAIPDQIQYLIGLKHLNLSKNRINVVPKTLATITKLKDLHLNGNPIDDKRLLKLIDQCRTKQVIDYVKQHGTNPPKESDKMPVNHPIKKSSNKVPVKTAVNKMFIQRHTEDSIKVIYMESVKDVRPFILCCLVRNLNLQNSNFKKFLQIQTKLHESVCEKREKSTIATHDLDKIKGNVVRFTSRDPNDIEIIPLGKVKKMSAQKLFDNLKSEAEALRKEKKRNVFSGIHKYLYMLDKKDTFAYLEDGEGNVISLPPLTNGDLTKISTETTQVLIEVTSNTSIGDCRITIEHLLKEMLLAGFGVANNTDSSEETQILNVLNVQQIKITDIDGTLRTVYPSKTDLQYDETNISIERE